MASPFDDEMPPQRQMDGRKSATAPLEILLQSLTRVVCILAAPQLKDMLIGWSSNRREETELSVCPEIPPLFLLFGPAFTPDINVSGFAIIFKGICYKII